MRPRLATLAKRVTLSICAMGFTASSVSADGFLINGSGPINRSMGGTAVAAPLDGIGSLYWNPATSSALPNSMDFGLEILMPRTTVSSTLPANLFGPGVPPVAINGSTRDDNGVFPMPSVGLIYRPDDSLLTFGLGAFPVGGFGVNYSSSLGTNPILTAPPLGLGAVFTEFQVLQITPTVAAKITDRLSIGIGPIVDVALLRTDPGFFFAPDDANGDGAFTYPRATHTRTTWGGGFQVGAYFTLDNGWQFGASYKSPQWFENFQYQSADELGLPRPLTLELEFPPIYSLGIGYSGFERWLFAIDFRYVDFEHVDRLRNSGFDATGAVRGLGWRSTFGLSAGAQFELTECISLRGGYSFCENPIPDEQSTFNVPSPLVSQHILYVGASCRVTQALTFSVAYAHAFENSIEGELVTPFGAIPGSSVRNSTTVDTVIVGATVRFGGCGANH